MSFSKTQVDRAGRELSRFLAARLQGQSSEPPAAERANLEEAIEVLEWWRGEHARPLSRVASNLRYYAAQHGTPTVAQRLKKAPTIMWKLIRQQSMRLSQMADIAGVRAVLPDLNAVQRVAVQLRRNWTITGGADYIARPKPDGYRALHLINKHRGRLIEVQLRTTRQDAWANAVEADGRVFAPDLKWGVGPAELTEYYAAVGRLLACLDAGDQPEPQLIAYAERLQEEAATFKASRRAHQ